MGDQAPTTLQGGHGGYESGYQSGYEANEELAREEEEEAEFYTGRKEKETEKEPVEAYDPQSQEAANIQAHKLTYGETEWQKVMSTETALQSNFIKFCDLNGPTLWPCLPLNLSHGPPDQAKKLAASENLSPSCDSELTDQAEEAVMM